MHFFVSDNTMCFAHYENQVSINYFVSLYGALLVFLEIVQKCLQHPHLWIQLAACQLYGQLFGAWSPAEIVEFSNKDPSRCGYFAQNLNSRVCIYVILLVTASCSPLHTFQ